MLGAVLGSLYYFDTRQYFGSVVESLRLPVLVTGFLVMRVGSRVT